MRPLYAISNELALLLNTEDGELPEGVENQIDALEIERSAKIEGCCHAIRNLEAEEAMLKIESDRFIKRAQVAANAAKRLKDYIQTNLELAGETKADAGLFKVRIQQNGQPSVVFDGDPENLPEEWQKTTVGLNNKFAVEAWKNGTPLPAGVSVVKGFHLRIV